MDAIELEAFAGVEATVNDPLVVRRGVRAGGAVRPVPWLGVVGSAGVYPKLDELDLTPLTRVLITENEIALDISRIDAQGALLAEITPIRTPPISSDLAVPFSSALKLAAGGGFVHTVDDLEVFGQGSTGRSDDAVQVHAAFAWSVAVDAFRGPIGLRVRYAQTRYTEQVAGRDERKSPVWLGADLVLAERLGGRGGREERR